MTKEERYELERIKGVISKNPALKRTIEERRRIQANQKPVSAEEMQRQFKQVQAGSKMGPSMAKTR